MNTLVRLLLIALTLFAPSMAHAANHGQREYRQGGYYQWDSYKCKWVWYATPAGAHYNNHASTTTYNLTINNVQPTAVKGNSQYLVQDSGYVYGAPLDVNKAFHLAGELQQLTHKTAADGFAQLTAFGAQAHANQLELEKERTQALKIQALAQIAESTKAQPSASFVRQQVDVAVNSIGAAVQGQAVSAGNAAQAEQLFAAKCAGCHGSEAATKGGGFSIPNLSSLTPGQKGDVMLRLSTHDASRRMPKGSTLADDELAVFLNFLVAK